MKKLPTEKNKTLLIIIVAIFLSNIFTAVFWNTYYVQIPWVVSFRPLIVPRKAQTPLKTAPTSKISTPSASLVPQVQASEKTIEPHKKFLTTLQYENQQHARKYIEAFYDADDVQAFDNVILSEGWYQTDIKNPTSGACGIGQALPCEKMGCSLDQSGLDCQIEWVMSYINRRYGSPTNAWAFRQANGWY